MALSQTQQAIKSESPIKATLRFCLFVLAAFFALFVLVPAVSAQGNRIPSTAAFSAGCSTDFGDIVIHFYDPIGDKSIPNPERLNPEWAVIISNSNKSILDQPLQVVEGFVTPTPDNEKATDQAHAEVAEEDIAWTHYTHDFTFKLTPDSPYEKVLSYYVNNDQGQTIGLQPDMEVEWDNASLMDEHEGFQRIWGAAPEFVWPAVNDRVWVLGRWIFDCGHPGVNSNDQADYVRYETEIHPPRALVTYRLYHPALDSFPRARTSEPNYPTPQSYLPVTGTPQSGELSSPTQVPLTEADIYVSGNGGGANDLCSLVPAVGDLLTLGQETTCGSGHTNPVLAVNDRNYVFDIYPPVTDYQMPDQEPPNNGTNYTTINGNKVFPFTVFPPTPDASLQYRIVDHSTELPAHACGGNDTSGCQTVTPIICLIDNTTPPPDQTETACPAVPARPTRLRVILPFKGTNANFFAQSILLGWDDVPNPNTCGNGGCNEPVRTFKVTLHKFTVDSDGAGCCNDGDWRVFLNVGGQWRYISPYFDTDAAGGHGIKAFDGGDNVCEGDALTENGDGDCFQFDNTPWIVSVGQQQSIHVGVGGFIARDVEQSGSGIDLCRNYPGGCDPNFTLGAFLDLFLNNDDRIGTYEFDLTNSGNYQRPNTFQIASFDCTVFALTGCEIQYTTDFRVEELDPGTPPASDTPQLGDPHFNNYVTSATPITLSSSDPSAQGVQYRFHLQGGALPTYTSPQPFPVHWANANFNNGQSVLVYLNGASAAGDGAYDFQYSANSVADLLELRNTQTVILDNTPPVATITQPAATQYGHSDTLTLNYSVSDGSGSGVKSFTPKMDGQTAAQFCAASNPNCLDSGQPIYLLSMSLGTHTFSVDSVDNLNNAGTNSAIFTITVTFDSLKGDVNDLVSMGCIDNISQSLLSKISAAQNLNGKGQIQAAINTLSALINEVQAQAGKHISTACTDPSGRPFNPVQLLLGDTQYLQGTLGQLKPNPVIGSVLNANNAGINGVTVNLVNSSKTVIATATTDSAGLFYFADTSGLTGGANYTVKVTLPKGYKSSTPASQAFTWKAVGVALGNFVLN